MGALTTFDLTSKQILLVQQTVAKDCNADEFNLFMEAARSYGLDPFRKQIMPLVFSKDNAKKRRMSIIVSRDGLRVIAQRCGNYRPADQKADWEMDSELISATNPKGIVSCTVYLWQQDKQGQWFKVKGEAEWDEFAPLSYPDSAWEWIETGEFYEDSNKPKRSRRLKEGAQLALDASGNWAKMPKIMLEKCAEAQALRAGWPDQFAGIYAEEELDRAKTLDLSATEIVENEREEHRMRAIGATSSITMTWGDGWALENVPMGEFVDRCLSFIKEAVKADVARWSQANRVGLQQFWAKHPGDALEIKKAIEAKAKEPEPKPQKQAEEAA